MTLETAMNKALLEPERSINIVKRLKGRKFDDLEVQLDGKWLPHDIANKGRKPSVSIKWPGGAISHFCLMYKI